MEESKEQKNNRRRALITTLVIHGALFILFLFVGLSYYDPKPEAGVLISFGYDDFGEGEVFEAPSSGSPQNQASTPVETQEVLTQDVVDAPTIDQSTATTSSEEPDPEPQETSENPETDNQDVPDEPDPKPSESLQNLINNAASSSSGGEGNTQGAGDMGDENGDPNSNNYSGTPGGGGSGDGNYLLRGRKPLSKPAPNPCEAAGRVVVKIYVDRKGNVINAVPGEKVPPEEVPKGKYPSGHIFYTTGIPTTTTSSCLFKEAKKAAESTLWQENSNAGLRQSGYIIYSFTKN